jgi:small subunit ribosomal protein S6
MAKKIEKYEAVVVFSVKNGEEQVKSLIAKFTELIKQNGELVNVDEWGKRKLAYPINYETEGYYTLFHFDSKPEFPLEFERVVRITDGILRSLVVVRQG